MVELFIFSQFISALVTTLIGVAILILIRRKTEKNLKEEKPVGFWVQAMCLGTDLAIIDILASFLAFRGSLESAGYITIVLTVSYFFFFWLFFTATPAMFLIRIRILSKEGHALKIWQVLARLFMSLFLFIGWIPMLFDRKERKALHDIVAKTRVAYTNTPEKVERRHINKVKLGMIGMTAVLLLGLIIHGLGEKLTGYTENNQMVFFDLDKDGMTDGITIDLDKDGKVDVFKYDLNNDRIIDFTTLDADKDGVAESIDINNDGRIDGFDFNNDNVLDIPVRDGQFFIWLWKILFGMWAVGFIALLIFTILKENKNKV